SAGRLVTAIANRNSVEIFVLSVVPDTGLIPLACANLWTAETHALDTVREETDRLRQAGFRAHGLVKVGSPAEAILTEADIGGFDLTVVGARTMSWVRTRLLGSVSTRVLHESPSSVLVLHEGPFSETGAKVLIGVDGSQESTQAVKLFSKLVDPELAQVRVTSVVSAPALASVPATFTDYAPQLLQLEVDALEEAKSKARGYCQESAAVLRQAGFNVWDRVEQGPPAIRLLEEAEEDRFDLVVVGSRGSGPVGRLLLGSVSDHAARLAPATLVARNVSPAA
ncbi:MAG: universal stress protein, partial [Acidimicrobiia bacterium]